MRRALDTFAATPPNRFDATLEAAALPTTRAVTVRGAPLAATAPPALTLALGGALRLAIDEITPDLDLFADDGPLADVVATLPDNPAMLAGACGAWLDEATVAWIADMAPRALAVAGLADTPFATALLGAETGLAVIDAHGRLAVAADRTAPLAGYSLYQIAELTDRAMSDAHILCTTARPTRRSVAASAGARGHASVFAALGQTDHTSPASAGTRFAWTIGQVVDQATEVRVTPGALAQLLLLIAAAGGPFLLALQARRTLLPADTTRLLAARAAISTAAMAMYGVAPQDEAAALLAVRHAWERATPETWRAASPHARPQPPPATKRARFADSGGGGTWADEQTAPPGRSTHAARGRSTDTASPRRRRALDPTPPRRAADTSESEASPPRHAPATKDSAAPKQRRRAPPVAPRPADADSSAAPSATASPARAGKPGRGAPPPPKGEERDAHNLLRCWQFAYDQSCSSGSGCKYSHQPARQRATAPSSAPAPAPTPAAAGGGI